MQASENISSSEPLYTVKQFPTVEPAFSEGSLRWLIFQNKEKLVDEGAIIFVGRKVLIDRPQFISTMKEGLVA